MNFKYIHAIIVSAALLCGASAFANSFAYSFVFTSSGTEVTGTFNGDLNGSFVENITDLTLTIDGMPYAGTLYSANPDGWTPTAVIRFTLAGNSFAFADADLGNGGSGYQWLFVLQEVDASSLGAYLETPGPGAYDLPGDGTWTLTDVTTSPSVPDNTSTLGLFILALAALGLSRRTFSSLRSR